MGVHRRWVVGAFVLAAAGCSVEPGGTAFMSAGSAHGGLDGTGAAEGDADSVSGTSGSGATGGPDGDDAGTSGATQSTDSTATATSPTTTSNDVDDSGSATRGGSCGDGVAEGEEDCDGGIGSDSCESLGFDGGTLGCTNACTWDTSGCHACGDGIAQGPEVCDGDDLGGTSCTDLPAPANGSFNGGSLACAAGCGAFDDGGCTWCGDGIKNGPESCDGNDLGGATCVEAGWLPGGGGLVSCAADCSFDDGLCTGTKCGGSLAAPADGTGTCPGLWADIGTACQRTCPQVGPNVCTNPLECPLDRACQVSCSQLNGCNGLTIQCAPGHTCDIGCSAQSSCQGATVVCPPDAPCNITCGGLNACSGLSVVCPAGNHACNLSCNSQSACANANLQCGDGPCSMSCSSNLSVCSGASVQCGTNACSATCSGNSMPSVICGDACSCESC